ncbi:MAG: response regulator [Candidatus Atribacteria bacterium]|nr:response regulator [Candidatus Atribacteria bacterium]
MIQLVIKGIKTTIKKIFIVDDNRFFMESLVFLLNRQNDMNVVGTHDRVQGVLEKIEVVKPDVIILDMRLPDGDGITLLKEINSSFDIPVIMLTMYEEHKEQAIKAGAFAYLVKGEGLDRLYQLIRKASKTFVNS